MVACAVGQAVGPYYRRLGGRLRHHPADQLLFALSLVGALLALALAFAMRPRRDRTELETEGAVVPVRELLRTPGLRAVLVVSVMTVTAQDLIVIYLPLLGTERGIDARDIGALLTVRAAASILRTPGLPGYRAGGGTADP